MENYLLNSNDSFYYNYNENYFSYDNFIVSIKFINEQVLIAKYDCHGITRII